MIPPLSLAAVAELPSPALVFDEGRIDFNLRRMIAIATPASRRRRPPGEAHAGSPPHPNPPPPGGREPDGGEGAKRLRPHAKTHKTREIAAKELDLGITKHKCATLAEAEMLAQAGAGEVLVSYPLVGPNLARLRRLKERHPATRFQALADSAAHLDLLTAEAKAHGQPWEVILDVDVGHRRTGIPIGPAAAGLYEELGRRKELTPAGLHLYDGHNTAVPITERQQVAATTHDKVNELRERFKKQGLSCPRLIFGGTPSFAQHAPLDWPEVELSPGTCVLHDATYARRYPELGFQCAAMVLTRLISKSVAGRHAFDCGSKAVAPDQALVDRVLVLGLEGATVALHNEEHLVLENVPGDLKLGQPFFALPGHVCPTVALYDQVIIINGDRRVGQWRVAARDRRLDGE